MIVVICGTKGGTGKTTLATNLAVMRSSSNKRVLLVDADEQKSSSFFANQRDGAGIETKWSTFQFGGKNLHSQILRVKDDYDDVIIDVGGRDTSSLRSALLIGDVSITPFCPASYDIWTLTEIKNALRDMKTANQKLEAFSLINRADPSGTDNDDAKAILDECEEMKCLDFTIGNRKAFRSSSSDGLGIIEMKTQDKKAIQEMTALYDFIYSKCIV